jgi:hypothetical protein
MIKIFLSPNRLASILKIRHPGTISPNVNEFAALTRYGSCWPPAPVSDEADGQLLRSQNGREVIVD